LDQEIDLLNLLKLLRKKFVWLLVLPGIAIFISWFISFCFTTPIYQTSTTLMLELMPDDSGNQQLSNYVSLSKSQSVLESVIEKLKLGFTYNQLSEQVSVSEQQSNLLVIKVRNTDPALAQQIANQVAGTFTERVLSTKKVIDVIVINEATLPKAPVTSNKFRNIAAAGVLAAMLAVGIILVPEILDNTIKTPGQIEEFLKLNLLVSVPDAKNKDNIIIYSNPGSPVSEAYHMLRTNLQLSHRDKQLRSLVVTSATSQEGTSTIAVNLAVSFAQTGSKVLLVDGNLRNPAVHNILSVPNNTGLANLIEGELSEDVYTSSKIGNLKILTSGSATQNPAIALSSKRINQLLANFEQDFDMVVIDAPSVTCSEASIWAAIASGTVINIRYGCTPRGVAINAVKQLRTVKANIVGVILNRSVD
jgi:receptor protein-tyrosine kinase